MKNEVEKFHNERRAFIIIPDNGIIISQLGSTKSHKEILQ